jgi:hypothetical protein
MTQLLGRRLVAGVKPNRTTGAIALAAAMALATLAPVSASTPTTVSYAACAFGGGSIVPAGSQISVRFGWPADTAGQIKSFLGAAAITAQVDGVVIQDPNQYFSAPQRVSGGWATYWLYDTRSTLAAGQSMVVTIDLYLSHKVVGPKDPDFNGQVLSGPGSVLAGTSCTIAAA